MNSTLHKDSEGKPWTSSVLEDQAGRRVIITGANSGIGFETARVLANAGANVTLACRDLESAELAANKIVDAAHGHSRSMSECRCQIRGSVNVQKLDLSSLKSVSEFASKVNEPVDLLINNAGIMAPPNYTETEDGHEMQWGVNHLGHFALTGSLWPALLAGNKPRVVNVSSIAHHGGDVGVLEANPRVSYAPRVAYSQSKLANLLFSRELQNYAGDSVTVASSHPGVSATNLFKSKSGMGANPVTRWGLSLVSPLLMQSSADGAEGSLYAATLGAPNSYTGPVLYKEWRGPIGVAPKSSWAKDDDIAKSLWDLSQDKSGVSFSI